MKISGRSKVRNIVFLLALYLPTAAVFYLAFTTEHTATEHFTLVRFLSLFLFVPILFKYLIQLFIAPWYPVVERSQRRKWSRVSHTPTVSVLISAWNEEVGIAATLRSVIATGYPSLEIIVVNDGSTDNTERVVRAIAAEQKARPHNVGVPVIYRYQENAGKARALNSALALAKGEIVITIDADSVMDAHAIERLVARFTNPKVASVAGNVAIGNRHTPLGLLQQLEYLYGFYFKRADSLFNAVYIVGGAAAAYRADIVRTVGGFDESIITEDIELSTRLQHAGYAVRYAADAVVYTEGPSDFTGLCRQRLRWKYGRLLTFYKYRDLFFSLRRGHNPYLSFFVLPIALFADITLFFEGVLLTVFYAYTFLTNDYVPLAIVITVLAAVVSLQIISDSKRRYHYNLFLLAPGAWLLFYAVDFVEYRALLESTYRLLTKRGLAWQRWVRQGVFQ